VDIIFAFYAMILMLRILLQMMHANYYNPLCQFVIRLTTPVIKPMQHWLPTLQGIDTAVLALVVALTVVKFVFLGWLIFDKTPQLLGIIVWTLGDLVLDVIHLFIYLIIGRVVLSLVHNPQLAPILEVLYQLTEPMLRQVKRFLPPIAGFDVSALFAALVLQLLVTLIVGPVEIYGQQLAFQAKIH
jgi:YggT family protein